MKIFIFFILCLFFIKNIYAEDIQIIELHNNSIDQIIIDALQQESELEELVIDKQNTSNINSSLDDDKIILAQTNTDTILEEDDTTNTDIILLEDDTKIEITEVITLPDLWEKINKEDLIFLLNNINSVRSITLRNELLKVLNIDNNPPKNFIKDDFENLIIKSLIKFAIEKKLIK